MTEIDALKYDLAQERKAFDKLHKQHIQLIHKQRGLEEKIKQLKHNHDVFVYRRMNDANKISDLEKENKQLKKLLECSREEANDYCEELMGKDEFIRLYKRQRDEVIEENEELKSEIQKLKNVSTK